MVISPVSHTDPRVLALIQAQQAELAARYGEDDDTEPLDLSVFDEPGPLLLLILDDGQPIGCGGIRRLDPALNPDTAEIKRMYVRPDARGRGVSKVVLGALEDAARQSGYAHAWLETGVKQPEAIRLYEKSSYTRIPNYGYYAGNPLSVCYAKLL